MALAERDVRASSRGPRAVSCHGQREAWRRVLQAYLVHPAPLAPAS